MSDSAQTREQPPAKLPPVRIPYEPTSAAPAVSGATIEESMIRLSDLLVTAESLQRRERLSKPRDEMVALDELAQIVTAKPQHLLRRFTDTVLRLFEAGSAGLSMLRPNSSGHTDFVWEVVSGALAAHQGDGTPRNFSPCGLCLDIGTAIVLERPERKFTYLARVQPAIFEALIGPLYDQGGTPLGALWVVHHEPMACFGANDVLIIGRLATQMVRALKLVKS